MRNATILPRRRFDACLRVTQVTNETSVGAAGSLLSTVFKKGK